MTGRVCEQWNELVHFEERAGPAVRYDERHRDWGPRPRSWMKWIPKTSNAGPEVAERIDQALLCIANRSH